MKTRLFALKKTVAKSIDMKESMKEQRFKLFEANIKRRLEHRKIASIVFKVMQPIETGGAQVRRLCQLYLSPVLYSLTDKVLGAGLAFGVDGVPSGD
jgi:Glu-tRNA(Gln) amidotransferase subunit E-like FAD-binding protein